MKLTSPKQRQGDHFETLAKYYLEAQGLTFFAKNWHYKNLGELDLVMLEPTQKTPCLVIVEVRQRKASQFGTSLDSITPAKQRKIIKQRKKQTLKTKASFQIYLFLMPNHSLKYLVFDGLGFP